MLFVGRKLNEKEHDNVVQKFSYILDKGYTFEECNFILLSQMSSIDKKKSFSIKDILNYTSYHANMIKQNKMYYHKELRIQSQPCTVDIDYNTGTMISTGQEFFVEIVASYTMEDLINYLLSFGYINTRQWQSNRLKGMIKHYVNKYGLDATLFMIDAVSDNIETKEFDLNRFDNYYSIAIGYMNNITNNCKANGGDKIEPRKRL